mgnify:CR=1 FL=1
MTERNLAIRLTVLDGGKVKAELREIGETGEKSLKRIELAGKPTSKALLAISAAANDVKGSALNMTGQLGPLGSALSAIGPYGLAAGVALSAVALGLLKGIEAAAQAEQSFMRLEAVLRATGNSSGLTANEIVATAEGIEKATLATAEQVQDAATVLATFRTVAGDTFTRTLTLAQDMSATFGGDLKSNVAALGKALEDPINGLGGLQKSYRLLTESQRDTIQTLVETGRQAEAQRMILDALEKKIGGSGRAETSGLAGATNRLSDAWGNLLKGIAQTETVSTAAKSSLSGLATVIEGLNGLLKDDTTGEKIFKAQEKLLQAQDVLQRFRDGDASFSVIQLHERRVARLQADLDRILQEAKEQTKKIADEKAAAIAGQEQAARDFRSEQLSQQRKALDDTLDSLLTEPSERIAKVNKELAVTKQRLDALREKDGSNTGSVDAAIREAETIAQRKIAAIEKPSLEAAKRVAQANQKVVNDLGNQIGALADKRAAFIQNAVSRLSDGATQDQQNEVTRLAAALYDHGEAQKSLSKLQSDGEQVTKSTLSATEAYASEILRLNGLLDAGAISQDTYNRAVAKAEQESLAARKDAEAGALRAFRAYREQAEDTAKDIEKLFTNAMNGAEDAIVEFVKSGGRSLKSLGDLFNSIMDDILRMTVRKSITEPLFNSLQSGGFSSFITGLLPFEQGGVMTSAGALPLHRYANGGIANSPQIAMFGEGRKPEAYVPLPDGRTIPVTMSGSGTVNVTINNNTSAKATVQQKSNASGGRDLIIQLDEMNAQLLSDPGSRSSRALARFGGLASR